MKENNYFVGIITMHKVLNYGSALQAFALQHILNTWNIKNEIIDYIFPRKSKKTCKDLFLYFLSNLILGFAKSRKKKRFKTFYSRYYRCSKNCFYNNSDLVKAKFKYNFYITGSDQVWNPKHVKNDLSFLLNFVNDDIPKISYAASVSPAVITTQYKNIYRYYLKQYKNISVRELSGINLIKELIDRNDVHQACDPTFLLSKDEWSKMCQFSKIKINKPYILVYILSYSYNPYPDINFIIDWVYKNLGYKLVILDGGIKDFQKKDVLIIKDAGPIEFINLIHSASFVITTSFHGTAFALNMEIPFFSVIKSYSGHDTRILDLLIQTKEEKRAILYTEKNITTSLDMDFSSTRKIIDAIRKRSIIYLQESLKFNRV